MHSGWGSGQSAHIELPSPSAAVDDPAQQDNTQMKILVAIQSLRDRLGKMETQRPASGSAPEHQEPSVAFQEELPSYQGEKLNPPDVLSLYAHSSLFESDRLSRDVAEEEGLNSSLCGGGVRSR